MIHFGEKAIDNSLTWLFFRLFNSGLGFSYQDFNDSIKIKNVGDAFMKLGCAAWCFSCPNYEPPYEKAIDIIGGMGFKGLELIAFEEKDLDEYYTPLTITKLRRQYESYGMELSEFAVYSPVIDGLASLDPLKKEQALEIFRKSTKIGKALGSQLINLVSHWVDGLKAPIEYPPCYITPYVSGIDRTSPLLKMELPNDFDWDKIWDNYVDSLRQCLEIVADEGMKFNIEGHANVIVSNTDTMLRLFDRIPSENFGVNFDTSWHLIQREYLPMSVRKLGKRLFHFHLRDADGMFGYNIPPGMGIIDWEDLFATLNEIGYDGYLSFELGRYDNAVKWIGQSKKYLEEQMQNAGIK